MLKKFVGGFSLGFGNWASLDFQRSNWLDHGFAGVILFGVCFQIGFNGSIDFMYLGV